MTSTPIADQPLEFLDGAAEVLAAVRLHRCHSRAEIVRRTGLSRMVTAQRVQQLLDVGLLHEDGLAPSRGGRRPRQLTFRPPGHVLVADIGWTHMAVAITDLTGEILSRLEEPTDVTRGPEKTLSQLERLFDQTQANCHDLGYQWGVGIGIPAPVEFSTGRAVSPPGMPGWDDYPVRERLSRRYEAPTWVDKDVNLMMLGEWRQGAAKGDQYSVFIKLGTGTGIALISAGRLHRGAQGCAGDIGNLVDTATSLPGSGFLAAESSSPSAWLTAAIATQARQLAESRSSPWLAAALADGKTIDTRLVAEAASFGDPDSVELLRKAGAVVGTALADVVSLFNPASVIIGGGMSDAGDDYLAAIREVVHGKSRPLATRDLRITKAALGATAGVIGAAAMVLDQLFSPDNLTDTVSRWTAASRAD